MRNSHRCLIVPVLVLTGALLAPARSAFTGLTRGGLAVTRGVHMGGATTFGGQPLPPVCPSTASFGKKTVIDSGSVSNHRQPQ